MKKIILFCVAVLVSGLLHAQKSQKVTVPAAVKSAFMKKFPNASAVKWSKESATEFESEFKNGSIKQAANFDASGMWVVTETEVKKADLPAPVLSAIGKDFSGYKVSEIEKVEKPNAATIFEAKVEKGEVTYIVEVSPEGKILKKEQEKEEKGKEEKKD
jgi:hypothetical protein